jgi:CheY-like chemotaxis protein
MVLNSKKRTVLLVNKDPAARGAIIPILKSYGYNVLPARSGPAALARSLEQPVDVVLLDAASDDLKEWQICDCLYELHPFVPVILTCEHDDPFSVAIHEQADAVFEHPIDYPALLSAIEGFLSESHDDRLERITHARPRIIRHRALHP